VYPETGRGTFAEDRLFERRVEEEKRNGVSDKDYYSGKENRLNAHNQRGISGHSK
jgi:hypothetical protein